MGGKGLPTENSGDYKGGAANLAPYQFKPGQSGNPGGRPKKLPITDYLVEQLAMPVPPEMKKGIPETFLRLYGENATFGELLAFQVIAKAADGDMKAIHVIFDRVEGKVSQNVALSSSENSEVVFRLTRVGF